MKKMIYAATVTLACITTIPVTLIGSTLNANAQTAVTACEFAPSSAATGDFIQQEIDSISHCNSNKDTTTMQGKPTLIKSMRPTSVNPNTRSGQEVQDENRLFCPTIPHGTTAEDFEYRTALERCKYGS